MRAGFVALEFDHDQVGLLVETQQIDPPPSFVPLAELLGNY
jgi:hypothetical protein